VYHIELREFPHNTHAYNLDAARLQSTVLTPWVAEKVFEVGGRQWIPQRTTLTILEGPELPLHSLGLGRGWNNALRKSKNVTDEVLGAAKTGTAAIATGARPSAGRAPDIERDILARCAVAPLSLPAVWDRAELVAPTASAGERLVLAEAALGHLLAEGHVELRRGEDSDATSLSSEDADAVLRTREAWGNDRSSALFVHAAA
jgi:hypothetical protein